MAPWGSERLGWRGQCDWAAGQLSPVLREARAEGQKVAGGCWHLSRAWRSDPGHEDLRGVCFRGTACHQGEEAGMETGTQQPCLPSSP